MVPESGPDGGAGRLRLIKPSLQCGKDHQRALGNQRMEVRGTNEFTRLRTHERSGTAGVLGGTASAGVQRWAAATPRDRAGPGIAAVIADSGRISLWAGSFDAGANLESSVGAARTASTDSPVDLS